MPLFTASARARRDHGHVNVIQMVVAAYHARHAIILLTDATLCHRIRIRWRQKLPMYELMRSSIIERPESCMLTPASACFVNIHNGNCYDVDANWYRNAVSRQH